MFLLYLFYTIIISIIGSILMFVGGFLVFLLTLIFPKNTYPILKFFAKIFVFCLGIKVKIEGEFPKNGPYIVMANHSSMIDPFLWGTFMKGKFTGIVADTNLKYPVYGWILKRVNAVVINRKNRNDSIRRIQKAEKVLKKGIHIGIHPEGTRTLTGKMNPLKKGGFYMAKNTNTSILPVGFDGAFKFKPKNRFFIKPTTVIIRIGDKISNKLYQSKSIDDLIDITTIQLKKLSGEIN